MPVLTVGTDHAEASAPCQALTADTHFELGKGNFWSGPRQASTADTYLELGKGDFGLAGGDLVKQIPQGGGALLHIGFYHHHPPHVPVPLHLQPASLQL